MIICNNLIINHTYRYLLQDSCEMKSRKSDDKKALKNVSAARYII